MLVNAERKDGTVPDARFEKSRRAIKDALLDLLGKKVLDAVSMSELARCAQVSRSTLYAHFGNVQEAYEELVTDFNRTLQPLEAQLHCEGCGSAGSRPMCVALRESGRYRPVVTDGRFLPTLLERLRPTRFENRTFRVYQELGLDADLAWAACCFQMSGCYAVALSQPGSADWPRVQSALDTFIRGGINALRTQQAPSA